MWNIGDGHGRQYCRCERCWTATLAEKEIAEREERCVEGKCTKKGTNKFFGHSVCKRHIENIPGPLEVYTASWILVGLDIDTINEGLDKIFNKGDECKGIKGNTTTSSLSRLANFLCSRGCMLLTRLESFLLLTNLVSAGGTL